MTTPPALDPELHKFCDIDITRLGRENEALQRAVAELTAEAPRADGQPRMTLAQRNALWRKCGDFNVPFSEDHYYPASDLPAGWYSGWIGGRQDRVKPTIYVGISPEGEINS